MVCFGCHRVSRAPFCRTCSARLRPIVRSNPTDGERERIELASIPQRWDDGRFGELGFDTLQVTGGGWVASTYKSESAARVLNWLPDSLAFERSISLEALYWLHMLAAEQRLGGRLELRRYKDQYEVSLDVLMPNVRLGEDVPYGDQIYYELVTNEVGGDYEFLTMDSVRHVVIDPFVIKKLNFQADKQLYKVGYLAGTEAEFDLSPALFQKSPERELFAGFPRARIAARPGLLVTAVANF